MISNHVPITGFACCGRGIGRSRQIMWPSPSDTIHACTSKALQAVAQMLLMQDGANSELESLGNMAATSLQATYDEGSVEATVTNLVFLAENTGVPRDMGAASAMTFRCYLQLMARIVNTVGLARKNT